MLTYYAEAIISSSLKPIDIRLCASEKEKMGLYKQSFLTQPISVSFGLLRLEEPGQPIYIEGDSFIPC